MWVEDTDPLMGPHPSLPPCACLLRRPGPGGAPRCSSLSGSLGLGLWLGSLTSRPPIPNSPLQEGSFHLGIPLGQTQAPRPSQPPRGRRRN